MSLMYKKITYNDILKHFFSKYDIPYKMFYKAHPISR